MPFPRSLFLLAAVFAGFAAGARAQGADLSRAADPVPMVRAAVDEVIAMAFDTGPSKRPLSTRLRPILDKYFDFDLATRFAVGIGWRRFTPDQRRRTTELFSELIIRTYADHFNPGEASRPTFAYGASRELSANRREVPSTLFAGGRQYSIAYRVDRSGGAWKCYDMVIEGVSMVANYRAQFVELFQQGGAEAIIRALQKNLDTMSAPGQ